jgi:hypothetical protein
MSFPSPSFGSSNQSPETLRVQHILVEYLDDPSRWSLNPLDSSPSFLLKDESALLRCCGESFHRLLSRAMSQPNVLPALFSVAEKLHGFLDMHEQ